MVEKIGTIVSAAAVENQGDPSVFAVVNAVQEFLEDPDAVAAIFDQIKRRFVHGGEQNVILEEKAKAAAAGGGGGGGGGGSGGAGGDGGGGGNAGSKSAGGGGSEDNPEDEEGHEEDGGEEEEEEEVDDGAISPEDLKALTLEASAAALNAREDADGRLEPLRWKGGKGGGHRMYWGNFTIGLVGKPSAGKSTFFNVRRGSSNFYSE